MAVRTQCPRCKQPLSVPNKLAGSYASCPRCQGRFWVSKDAPTDPPAGDSVGGPPAATLTLTRAPDATPPASGDPVATPPPVPPRQYFPSVTPLAPAPAPTPAPSLPVPVPPVNGGPSTPPTANTRCLAPPQSRKVARLVTADTALSTLKLAADGQLPQLQLQEGDKKDKGQGNSRSVPPLVMIGAWIFSVAVTVAIVLLTGNNDDSAVTTDGKKEALARIEDPRFFGDPARHELLPYQRLLRKAVQARARGDFKAERLYYKQVLDLLHTETWDSSPGHASGAHLEKGITGSRENDHDLEGYVLKMLGD